MNRLGIVMLDIQVVVSKVFPLILGMWVLMYRWFGIMQVLVGAFFSVRLHGRCRVRCPLCLLLMVERWPPLPVVLVMDCFALGLLNIWVETGCITCACSSCGGYDVDWLFLLRYTLVLRVMTGTCSVMIRCLSNWCWVIAVVLTFGIHD